MEKYRTMRTGNLFTVLTSYRMMTDQAVLELIFPKNIFEWFTVAQATRDKETVRIIFEEKNIPPGDHGDKTVISKGFHDITITDFPIRGRRTLLTFRRRRWQVEGEPGLLKRDITLSFPGTQLEQEFAAFLKDRGRD